MIPEDGTGGCCPKYHRAVELIGRRWTGAIVAVLMDADGPLRFSALRSSVPGLSDRVLSQRLRELEAEGLVARSVDPDPPLRVDYALTAKGHDLAPVVDALERWGQTWMSGTSGSADETAPATHAAAAARSAGSAPARSSADTLLG